MAKVFPYKIQANGRAYAEALITSNDIATNWEVFHKNPDDKGLWIIDTLTGNLRINSNQNGLSGRYSAKDLDKKDYTIETELIPSATDDDSFGIVFRYQDNFHFYFVAWDGGGDYGWGTQTLRLYKVIGDEYKLLASTNIGHWVGGQAVKMDAKIVGNQFTIFINGIERINYTDNLAPYTQGAYGPCATSQIVEWKRFFVRGEFDFMVEEEFEGEVDQTNYNYATAKAINSLAVKHLMADPVKEYIQAKGYKAGTAYIKDYAISTSYTGVNIYFDTVPVSKKTTNEDAFIKGYMLYADTPPIAPKDLKGEVLGGDHIEWTWTDTSMFETGFEILDEFDNVIAVVGANTTIWLEGPLFENRTYTRKVRAYNASGRSGTVSASATTESTKIYVTPAAPINLRGMVQGTSVITWYWDKVSNADYYQLWDAVTNTLIETTTEPRFKEENLTQDTLYRRYVTATNIAGKSSNSIEAMAFTDAEPVALDIPETPLFFSAETLDSTSILWTWQEPDIKVETTLPDGTARTEEEMEEERQAILSTYSYRVYDINGEVLYEAPTGVLGWTETNLHPETAYTHYVKAFVGAVESIRSNYAYATTEPEMSEIIEEEEEPIVWPLSEDELVCEPYETEPNKRIEAFHNGVGDNLDLKVRPNGQVPEYKTGSMRRDIPEDFDGDGEPDYGEDGTGGIGEGQPGAGGDGGWPTGGNFDGGIGGGIGNHGGWTGWGPGNPLSGGHGPIGHGGYGGYDPGYGINDGGINPPIGHDTYGDTVVGLPGYIPGSEVGVCTIDSPRESFRYDVQIQGTEFVDIDIYDKQDFEFRFKGEGFEVTRDYVNDYIGKLFIYPQTDVEFKITAEVPDLNIQFQNYIDVLVDVHQIDSSDVQYSVTPYADIRYQTLEMTFTNEEIFNGPNAHQWGANTWLYDDTTGYVTTAYNASWSGVYNTAYTNLKDYEVSFSMGVMNDGGDNDFIGFAFRLRENVNGTRRFYYFGTDNGGSGLGKKWGLYKANNVPNYNPDSNSTNVSGYSTLVAYASMSDGWVEGTWYDVKVVAQGTRIKIYVDGSLVVDVEDNDPMFERGSWGPTTASQEGASYRDFSFKEGTQERIYGDAIYDTLDVLVNTTPETAKTVTSETLSELMSGHINAAHLQYITITENPDAKLFVDSYGVASSRDYLSLASKTDGTEVIKMYATSYKTSDLKTKVTQVAISEPIFSSSIEGTNNSPSTAAHYTTIRAELIASMKSAETYAELVSAWPGIYVVDNFIAESGISPNDIVITGYDATSTTPNVYTFVDQNDGKLYAWTDAGEPEYYAEKSFVVSDYVYQEQISESGEIEVMWQNMGVLTDQVVPVNADGEPYTGDINDIVYKIIYNSPDYEVAFTENGATEYHPITTNTVVMGPMETSTYILAYSAPPVYYRVNKREEFTFSDTTPGALTRYFSMKDLVPEVVNYPNARYGLQLVSTDGDVWIAFGSDEIGTKHYQVTDEIKYEIRTDNPDEVIAIGTDGKPSYRPWTGYTTWYKGSVNGAQPLYQDEDGKKDLYVPVDLDVPSDIEIERWIVEVRGNPNIQYTTLNGLSHITEVANDTAHFYSDVKTTKPIGRKWYGPKYTVEYSIDICGTVHEEFIVQAPAPANDPILSELITKPPYEPPADDEYPEIVIGHFSLNEETGELVEEEPIFTAMETAKGVKWETIVTSRNPNVAIKVVSEPNYSAEGGIFLPLKVKAYIINPIQTPWNPLIHNGYYYLNQKEYFLYANTRISGKFVETEGFQAIDVPYAIKVYCERLIEGTSHFYEDTHRSDYKGMAALIDLDTSLGDMVLATNTQGEYYSSGTYTSDTKVLSDIPEYWEQMIWDAETPADSAIKVETSTMDSNGAWTGWMEVANGDVIPSPVSKTLRYRVTLKSGMEVVMKDLKNSFQAKADWNKGTYDKALYSGTGVKMSNPTTSPTATWTSQVMDLSADLHELSTITWIEDLQGAAGAGFLVETATADSAIGPWDAWTPLTGIVTNPDGTKTGTIDSVKKRFLKVRYTFNRGSILKADYEETLTKEAHFLPSLVKDESGRDISYNVKIVNDSIELMDPNFEGAYITPTISFYEVVELKRILLNAKVPKGGSLAIYTMTTNDPVNFDALLFDKNNWVPLSPSGEIMSATEKYLKAKIMIKPGEGSYGQTDVVIDTFEEWTEKVRTLSNAMIDAAGAIVIEDPEYLSYVESEAIDFTLVQSWLQLSSLSQLNDGTITLYTATSSSSFGNWEEWKPLTELGMIQSTPNRFIRFRAEFTGNFTVANKTDVYNDVTKLTGTFVNTEVTSGGKGITQTDPANYGYFTSDVFELKTIKDYKTLTALKTLATNGSARFYTRTSFDGVDWTAWEEVAATDEILSPDYKYFQYRVDLSPGVNSVAVQKILDDISAATNTETTFYSEILDFGGQVSALGQAILDVTSPSEGGSIKVYTSTANTPIALTEDVGYTLADFVWTEAVLNGTAYDIKSEPGRYIRYRIDYTSGYDVEDAGSYAGDWSGTLTNATASETGMTIIDPAIEAEYLSPVLNFGDLFDKFTGHTSVTADVTGVDVGGEVELFIKAAATAEGLASAVETSYGVIATGPLTATTNALADMAFVQYRLVIRPGTTIDGIAVAPTVNSVSFAVTKQDAILPVVNKVQLGTTATGFQAYEASTVENISLTYDYKKFTSPRLEKVTVSAMNTVRVSPTIDSITAIADINEWFSPIISEANILSKVTEKVPCTPKLSSIRFGAKLSDRIEIQDYTISQTARLVADMQTQQLTDEDMKDIVDKYFKDYEIDETNLTRKQYEIFTSMPDVELDVRNSDIAHYTDGLSPVFARTTSTTVLNSFSQTKFVVDDKNQVLVSPVPQQGAPVVVKDGSGREMKQVAFFDEKGKLTLWYKDCGPTDGTRKFLLDHADIDPATLEIEVDEDPNQPYTKLVEGEDYVLCNNVVTFRKLYPECTTIWYKYILKNSFIVDYNYNVAEGMALITLHNPVLSEQREVEIAYETDQMTAYYKASEIDLNPMRNALNEGFIYLTDTYEPAVKLKMRFNPNTLNADGRDHTTIQVIAEDRFGNPVVGDAIRLTVTDGTLDVKNQTTDMNGMVTALYTTGVNAGDVKVTAEDTTAKLEAEGIIHLRNIHPEPRAEIELSAQEITPDGIEKVKITARIVNEEQKRAVGALVLFETPLGTALDFGSEITNYEGEAHNYIRITSASVGKVITIKVIAPELNVEGYANLLIKEVAQFV